MRELKPQRVCVKCFDELKLENKYFSGREFLKEGQGFKKIEMMGMSSKLCTMKVTADFKALSLKSGFEIIQKNDDPYDDDDESAEGARYVNLSQIEKVELKGLTSFDIIWRDSTSSSVRNWGFEGDTHQTASTWVWYLAEACRRSRTPSLKTAVELERRQREEKDRRMNKEKERHDAMASKRAERMAARDGVSRKYSNSRRNSLKENNNNM